jgi:hypothetical protein
MCSLKGVDRVGRLHTCMLADDEHTVMIGLLLNKGQDLRFTPNERPDCQEAIWTRAS